MRFIVFLFFDRQRATWPSPESLVGDLGSTDDGTRGKALRLFGYPKAQMEVEVPKPEAIELRYAEIGDDNTLQAVVAITINFVMTYVAVAVPEAKAWTESAWLPAGASTIATRCMSSWSCAPAAETGRQTMARRESARGSAREIRWRHRTGSCVRATRDTKSLFRENDLHPI